MDCPKEDWREIANHKNKSILAQIPKAWNIPTPGRDAQKDVTGTYIEQYLNDREKLLTKTDAVTVIEKIASREWTAGEVTQAFCHRAALAHQLSGCLHETFFDQAVAQAKELDQYQVTHGKTVGPLHGLPISMKDQFHIKNTDTTMGYLSWIGTFEGNVRGPAEMAFESEIVQILRGLGAVFYCKTSVPQALMAGETVNNMVGYVYNPTNRNLSAGGSSGGEGALISLGGSIVGFGSDIGGSIRVPAGWNGLYGIRPSSGRLPYRGVPISMDGQESIPCVIGPMASTLRSLELVFKSVLDTAPWLRDPQVLDLPWRDDHVHGIMNHAAGCDASRLAIGMFEHDGIVRIDPPVRRALRMIEDALRNAGHETLAWKPPSHQEGWELGLKTWLFEGGRDIHSSIALSGETMSPQLQNVFGAELKPEKGAQHIAEVNVKLRAYREKYADYWQGTSAMTSTGRPVDAFISPIAPFAACLPYEYLHYTYTTVINALDYSAVAMPVTTVDSEVDVVEADYQPLNAKDERRHSLYDPHTYHGAHVGVQVVTRRLQEEKAIAVCKYLDSLLHN